MILPQAVRRVGPPLLNDFIALQKDVALVSLLGVAEAFQTANVITASTFNYTPLMAAALLYLCVTVPLARLVDRTPAKVSQPYDAAALVEGALAFWHHPALGEQTRNRPPPLRADGPERRRRRVVEAQAIPGHGAERVAAADRS